MTEKYILRMKRFIFPLLLCFFANAALFAQNKNLSVEEAISLGLQNNFSIQIANRDTQIANNNNTIGNAGFLPSIGASSSVREGLSSVKSEDTKGIKTENSNQRSSALNMALSLDWTIFNGMGMFIKKDRLNSLQNLQQSELRGTIENVLSEIVVSYYTVVQLLNGLKVMQNAIDFSNSRYDLIKKKFEIGSASELAFLKASTDLNADSTTYLRALVSLQNAKTKLNTLLVVDPAYDFIPSTPLNFDHLLDINSLKESLLSNNVQLSMAQQNTEISLLNFRLTNSPKYPQIDFYADYNFSKTTYDYGFLLQSQNRGPVAGLTLYFPIFDGLNKRRVTANAKLDVESSKLMKDQILTTLQGNLLQLFNDYQNNLRLVRFETKNLKVSQYNSKIAFEKFRLGEMSDYELREIQLSQLRAENSIIAAQFLAKKSETELLRISGKLIESTKK